MTYKLNLTIGDFSDDGHGKTQQVYLSSNYDRDYVRAAMWKALDKQGLTEFPCTDYEDNLLSQEQLRQLGIDKPLEAYESIYLTVDDGKLEMDSESITNLFIDFIQTHSPEIQLTVIKDDSEPIFFCGPDQNGRRSLGLGYGLFY
ncbi:hypothetical protein CLV58_1199 [Spirosoma oryzae]|uniref:Uncharacterized protein n=1 Tax=Spirosoma oryzae TaxID=1469603 RepID=A0A2T0SKC8_9BACT|nr:hypothetical protein [Spirosoma oryzae]PRY33860.1 hypothetical protein CLV58_1199 [Spirosoma oryzae]